MHEQKETDGATSLVLCGEVGTPATNTVHFFLQSAAVAQPLNNINLNLEEVERRLNQLNVLWIWLIFIPSST